MLVTPNQSVFQGRVCAIRAEADGWGGDVELLVTKNESPSRERDFLRLEPGAVVTIFAADLEQLRVGAAVRVRANLTAGPFGGRAVAESVDRL